MPNLDKIQQLVKLELKQTDALIREKIASDIPLANTIADYILSSGGKRVRPLLVLLSAKACQTLDGNAVTLAATIELLHTATLLHDDVVDDSSKRRGKPTANEQWGNEASVLVGDLLYARAFAMIAGLKHPGITQTIADATGQIVEGEVLQLMHCHDTTTTQATYLDIIQRKTGVLFAVAAEAGPVMANCSPAICQGLYDFGLNLGIAFQLLDDALDYEGDAKKIGKNLGDDLSEGKPTLPLIYLLQHGDNATRKIIAAAIKSPAEANLSEIQALIQKAHALTYCQELAAHYLRVAHDALNVLADSPEKSALIALGQFVIARDF